MIVWYCTHRSNNSYVSGGLCTMTVSLIIVDACTTRHAPIQCKQYCATYRGVAAPKVLYFCGDLMALSICCSSHFEKSQPITSLNLTVLSEPLFTATTNTTMPIARSLSKQAAKQSIGHVADKQYRY
jgi:hypothetical protein